MREGRGVEERRLRGLWDTGFRGSAEGGKAFSGSGSRSVGLWAAGAGVDRGERDMVTGQMASFSDWVEICGAPTGW